MTPSTAELLDDIRVWTDPSLSIEDKIAVHGRRHEVPAVCDRSPEGAAIGFLTALLRSASWVIVQQEVHASASRIDAVAGLGGGSVRDALMGRTCGATS